MINTRFVLALCLAAIPLAGCDDEAEPGTSAQTDTGADASEDFYSGGGGFRGNLGLGWTLGTLPTTVVE